MLCLLQSMLCLRIEIHRLYINIQFAQLYFERRIVGEGMDETVGYRSEDNHLISNV